jgi:hypothetical protein
MLTPLSVACPKGGVRPKRFDFCSDLLSVTQIGRRRPRRGLFRGLNRKFPKKSIYFITIWRRGRIRIPDTVARVPHLVLGLHLSRRLAPSERSDLTKALRTEAVRPLSGRTHRSAGFSDSCGGVLPLRYPGRKRDFRRSAKYLISLERAKGFEPSTPTLARLCSTPELHPHPRRVSHGLKGAAPSAKLCQRAPGFATAAPGNPSLGA